MKRRLGRGGSHDPCKKPMNVFLRRPASGAGNYLENLNQKGWRSFPYRPAPLICQKRPASDCPWIASCQLCPVSPNVLVPLFELLQVLTLPIAALAALMFLATAGPAQRPRAHGTFLAALMFVMITATVTVIRCDDCWLIHTAALGIMIVGALTIPTPTPLAIH